MGRDIKAADERDACSKDGGGDLPANPYPAPELLLDDRPGYPFAVSTADRAIASTEDSEAEAVAP